MLQEDLDALSNAPLDRSLEGLESDVWRSIEARAADRRTYSGAFAVQVVILTAGALASAAVGHQWATAHQPSTGADVFSPHTRLAASTLLVGDSR